MNWNPTELFKLVTGLESRLAAHRGRRERDRLMKAYPGGLEGWVGEVYLTRAKRGGWHSIKDWLWPITHEGYVPSEQIKRLNKAVYEVVHHAHLYGRHSNSFVLSLFPVQLSGLIGNLVTINKYACIRHPLHYLTIDNWHKTSTELYVQDVSDVKMPEDFRQ